MRNAFLLVVMLSIMLSGNHVLAEEGGDGNEDESVETKLPMGPILLGSFGLTTVVIGAGLGWQAYEENKDFNKEENGSYPLATNKLADDIETHCIVADVLMFGGLAVMIGSVLWWLIDDDYDLESDRAEKGALSTARWRPGIGPGQASLTIEF